MSIINNIFKDKNLLNLLLFGFIIRLALFFGLYPDASVFPDSGSYFHLAKKMSTFSLEGYSGERSPGYPILLLFAIGKVKILIIYQFLLGTICSLFWYKTLVNFKFTNRESFCITILLQLFINVFFYETAFLIESFALFCMSIVIYIITKPNYSINKNYKVELLLSIVLGYLVLIKPFFAYLPFLIYGLFTLKKFNFRNLINKKLILFIFPLVVYFGWSYVNKINTGYFVSTTFFGLNLAQNCVYFAEKSPDEFQWVGQPYAEFRDKTILEERDVAMSIWNAYGEGKAFDSYGLSFVELSHEFGEYAKATIISNPKDYAKQVVTRSWLDFWEPSISWNEDKFRFNSVYNLFVKIWDVQKIILYTIVVVFILISFVVYIRAIYKRHIDTSFIIASFVIVPSILQAMVTYGTNSRYSYPFDFIMVFMLLIFLKEKGIWNKLRKVI